VIPDLNGSVLAGSCNPPTFLAVCARGWDSPPALHCLRLDYTLVLFAVINVPQSQCPEQLQTIVFEYTHRLNDKL